MGYLLLESPRHSSFPSNLGRFDRSPAGRMRAASGLTSVALKHQDQLMAELCRFPRESDARQFGFVLCSIQ